MRKPKFKVDDLVWMKDNFHFNPCEDVISIGRVIAIHIKRGRELGFNPQERRTAKRLNHITYSVSGFTLQPKENQLELYKYA